MSEEVRQRNDILEQLCFYQGQNGVNLRTWGGYQFTCSRIVDVSGGIVQLTDVKVFIPGSTEVIFLNSVAVNACAITSFGISDPAQCATCGSGDVGGIGTTL